MFNLDAQIEDMDRAGIDVAVLSCILGWDTTLENCRSINDSTGEVQRRHASRFVGLAHIPPMEGKPALEELERAVGEVDPKIGKNADGIREYIETIQVLPLDARVKDDMLGGTAARLLKIAW